MQFVPDQRRYFCGSCSHWSDPVPTQAPTPDPRNPACPTCSQPTRLDMAQKKFFCDQCQRFIGEGAAQAIAKHQQKKQQKQKNKLGAGAWLGLLGFVVLFGGGFAWFMVREKAKEPKRHSRERIVPMGEEQLAVSVGTATQRNNRDVKAMNSGLQNLIVSKHKEKGQIVLRFNFGQKLGGVMGPMNLFIRFFDSNGKYLSRLASKELFLPKSYVTDNLRKMGVFGLPARGVVLRYAVNRRDLDYAKRVEVGFLLPP